MKPSFFIRNIPVYGDLILSPMAGFSDVPFRLICREFGMSMSYTEVISMDGILWNNKKTFKLLDFLPSERPVTFQILGNDEDKLVAACRLIEPLRPDIIDINMGCSVSDIAGKGAGAGLLKNPSKVGRIFYKLTRALSVPVTGKIRLGWDNKSRNYYEVAKILEDNGASLIAVHGRTRSQFFFGKADWDAIAEIKQKVKIPVIGNGDVKCVADIERIKKHTGCDGVMVGRAAIGNPWIFQHKDREQVPNEEKIKVIRRHLLHMLEYYGHDIGVILFRKHVIKYILGMHNATELRQHILKCCNADGIFNLISSHIERIHKQEAA
ncbi:MAG TPA: tRNA dihydrouridine synthase DusB [Candidatus Wujingus californicus]|uniref:tRNA dihydrouridine synthase DusB n=2 Tax=Candidatus Wujingus californicus TaxID=3367618 RepID=UPI001DD5BB60|nr:tRNA dihydrouridine synthase DusB [Planctomycetota bacterium]MDO8131534.1 tRNA dihydrouridine synthase DusB [Candidatus Brocadiales bacterium]